MVASVSVKAQYVLEKQTPLALRNWIFPSLSLRKRLLVRHDYIYEDRDFNIPIDFGVLPQMQDPRLPVQIRMEQV